MDFLGGDGVYESGFPTNIGTLNDTLDGGLRIGSTVALFGPPNGPTHDVLYALVGNNPVRYYTTRRRPEQVRTGLRRHNQIPTEEVDIVTSFDSSLEEVGADITDKKLGEAFGGPTALVVDSVDLFGEPTTERVLSLMHEVQDAVTDGDVGIVLCHGSVQTASSRTPRTIPETEKSGSWQTAIAGTADTVIEVTRDVDPSGIRDSLVLHRLNPEHFDQIKSPDRVFVIEQGANLSLSVAQNLGSG